MARIALVSGPDPGHALPVAGLARALRARGHQADVMTSVTRRDVVSAAGARFRELPGLAPTGTDRDIGHLLWQHAADMAPAVARALAPAGPDLVVVDTLTRAGAFAAELLGVRWVELIPHHLAEPAPDIPPVGLGRLPARTPWRRRDDARIHRHQLDSLVLARRQEQRARERLGLSGDGAPTARLLATLPALEHPRARWPERTHLVGPLAADPPMPPVSAPPGEAPLVVVTDSTASGVDRSLAGAALRGLRHAGVRLAVTSGRRELPRWPAGAVVGPAPHGPLLAEAAVAVGFGGAGFVGKALARGVPLVVVPLQGDQRETAARVRWAGAGLRLPLALATPTTLRWAVLRVLTDPRFARAARHAADGAAPLGAGYAAGLVERALTGALPPAEGPTRPA